MKMFRFKFDHSRIKNEEFDFFKGQGRKKVTSISKFHTQLLFDKHMEMFLFKFHRNQTITKNYFSEGGRVARRGPPILNFIIIHY